MFKKKKVKSATSVPKKRNKTVKKLKKPDNLYVSPSFLHKFDKVSVKETKSQFSGKSPTFKQGKSVSSIPKDVAAHFGNFYGLRNNTTEKQQQRSVTNLETSYHKAEPRSEFTRQMVHKLESMAGTGEYARQVSALLEETVEPPNFRLSPLPAEDSIPDGRHNLRGYPLWYKEPYKMPFLTNEMYKLLAEEYEDITLDPSKTKDVFDDESSVEETVEESNEHPQNKAKQNIQENVELKYFTKKPGSSENAQLSLSSSDIDTETSGSTK